MSIMNTLYLGDCIDILNKINDDSVDLILTSPPYDNLRVYGGIVWNFDIFKKIAIQLERVLKKGGVIVWIVNDATVKGSETGSSFRQVLYFKEIGLNIHDTMIWEKDSSSYPSSSKSVRYTSIFEFMFILSKGKPKTINLITDKVNKHGGKTSWNGKINVSILGVRNNIWKVNTGYNMNKDKTKHPAIFPEKLVEDHIKSWSNEEDVVLDCFAGSGTTLKIASILNRKFIGIEINKEYIDMINKRLNKYDIKFFVI